MRIGMKDWTIKLPSFTAGDNSLSEIIITLLTDEWPLSSKGVYNRIRQAYGKEASIQGVHKALKRLHSEHVVVKVDNYYKLNPTWLEQLGIFSSKVKGRYKNYNSRLRDLP